MSTRLIYDVSIWEEIRPSVHWKTGRLVGNINEEILKDRSLAEFQGKHPVPWQLRELMEQRANVWVQRLYDLCCDAYKSSGKAQSADFDRAVWAYCIEPFIQGEKQSVSDDYPMSWLLELLLCAVGSVPEKRDSLKVSQKDCCFDVRRKVYETWSDKLHHLPPRINEAVAAISRFNAMERRAARIVAGLPPDPPSPPPTAPAPVQSAASGPSQTTPVPVPATVSAASALNLVQDAAAEPLAAADGDGQTLSNAAGAATWEDIEILFLSDERVQICNGTNRETRNYAEFGLVDGRTGSPNQAWGALRALAEHRGVIQNGTALKLPWPKVEKRIQEIRKVLREHFGISADPIPFVEGVGYQARFKLGCAPSFHT